MNAAGVFLHTFGMVPVRVVALHGLGGTHRTFAPMARACERAGLDGAIVAPDCPGYGRSPDPPEWSLATIAAQLATAIAPMVPAMSPPVTIVGHCSGAILAPHLAREWGSRVARVVLLDPLAVVPWYVRLALVPGLGRVIGGRALARSRDVRRATMRRYLAMLGGIDSVQPFADLRVPVTLAHGDGASRLVRNSIRMWREVWPNAEVREIAGAGRWPLLDAPAAVADLLATTDRIEVGK